MPPSRSYREVADAPTSTSSRSAWLISARLFVAGRIGRYHTCIESHTRRNQYVWGGGEAPATHPGVPLRPGTRNEAIDRLNEIFVVLATSTIRGLPTEVELGPDDGIPRRCVLNADHTATIAKEHLGELITTLGLRATCRGLPGTGPRDGLLSRFVVLRWGCERDVAA